MTKIIVGIDPGQKGAMAVRYEDDLLLTYDLKDCIKPTLVTVSASKKAGKKAKGKKPKGSLNSLDACSLQNLVKKAIPWSPSDVAVFCEDSLSLPHDGKKTARSVFDSRGVLRAVFEMLGFKVHYVQPQTWKKVLKLRGQDKAASVAKACALFPKSATLFTRQWRGKTILLDGRAEAALIAYYGSLLPKEGKETT
jgi:hypothetical protein